MGLGVPRGIPSHQVDEQLVARIEERLRRGLPPPPEIYHVHNRDKIDWSQLPVWAMPLDPDLFADCPHEG